MFPWQKIRLSAVRLHERVSEIPDTGNRSFEASVPRVWPRLWAARAVWPGTIAFAVSVVGTKLLRLESLRVLAVLLLLGAAVWP